MGALYPIGHAIGEWSLLAPGLSAAHGMARITGGLGPLVPGPQREARASLVVAPGGASLLATADAATAPVQPMVVYTASQEVWYAVSVPASVLGTGELIAAVTIAIEQIAGTGKRTADVATTFCAGLVAAGSTVLFALGTTLPTGRATRSSLYRVTLTVTSTGGQTVQVPVLPIRCPA